MAKSGGIHLHWLSLTQKGPVPARLDENGDIDRNERDYLLLEIRDIRAAQECAGNEQLARNIYQACNVAMAVI